MFQQINRRYKKEQNGILELKNIITEIKKTQWMSSTVEWREQRKESVNLKIE